MYLSKIYNRLLNRIAILIKIDHTVVNLTLCMFSILLILGTILEGIPDTPHAVPSAPWVWLLVFTLYGGIKLLQTLGRTHPALRLMCSVGGLYIWTYATIVFNLAVQAVPPSLLLIMPILCELGYLSSLIYAVKVKSYGRRLDDS